MKFIGLLGFLISVPALGWTLLGSTIEGWDRNPLVVGFNPTNCSLSEADMNAAIDAALEIWNGAYNSGLQVTRATSTTTVAELMSDAATDTPVILCDPNLGATVSVDPNTIPGVTVRVSANPKIIYGGILLNTTGAAGDISALSTVGLQIVIAHELGHVFGLGHSSVESALMYFSISNKSELFVSQDDTDGLAFLYPRNEFSAGAFGCSAVRPVEGNGQKPLWFFGVLVAFLLMNRWVGRRFNPVEKESDSWAV